jgi:hypothetical protein
MFKAVNECIISEGVSWSNYIGICMDGAAAFIGHKKGFQAEVRQVAPHVNFIHCIIHKEASTSRYLHPQSHTVLQEAVKVVNFLKARSLCSRLFAALCEEMQAEHKSLVLHSEVR